MSSGSPIERFRACIPLFQALGDEYRQDIILLLAEKEKLTVNEITEHSPLSRPAISHHLKVLRQADLVVIEQKGTQRIYSLSLEQSVEQLKKLLKLVEDECI
ncbi:ArsR/SmtB family transcription factor [Bacillus weihaiensis]|uniref:Transcriptional regulator n=1 Tax=Bacillus weihaiensis TaxID=1547283 RepID=A0A1L3MN71_9BACI|nr:metalloregulator ArsR/SmtB family transcription factor [Bacillus weihaiensis]APH03714.1 transcriptional regulator [Bacillus weihaiensis]